MNSTYEVVEKLNSSSSSNESSDEEPKNTTNKIQYSKIEVNYMTPDQLLNFYGVKNLYLIWIWLAMSIVWALSAMPMMVSAFITDDICELNSDISKNISVRKNCSPVDGTIFKEFNLNGSEANLVDYSTTSFLFGIMIGSTFLPLLADQKGRRLILLICLFLIGSIGCLSALSSNIYIFIGLRFFQGLFFTGVGITNWVLAYECIPIKLRSYTTMIFGLFWVLGYCIVAPIAYYLPNWRHLIVAVSAPSLIFSIIYYFLIPESFHYLVAQNNIKAVEKWIAKANQFAEIINSPEVKLNSAEFCENFSRNSHCEDKEPLIPKPGIAQQLAKNRLLLIYTMVMAYLWTCDTFVYYGLSLFSTQLAGNRYINFSLMGLIEIPSYILSPFFLDRLGRKIFVSCCHFLAAISFLVIIFTTNSNLSLAMWLMGKFAIASSFTSLFVYASEIFPTISRNGCIGICSFIARTGGTLAPFVKTMAQINALAPTIFFCFIASLGGFLTILLPETLNKELPDF